MNSFEKHGLDEHSFEDRGLSSLRTFDAFPKTKPTYQAATDRGGKWTVVIASLCLMLAIAELKTWWAGIETHHFSVEQGVGHELQLNLDLVVAMTCDNLHINVQDAAMDRILASEMLTKEDTNWNVWIDRAPGNKKKGYKNTEKGGYYNNLEKADLRRRQAEEEDSHVGHVLGHMREGGRKFVKSPKLKRSEPVNACRIFGSLEGNKVQGDFHITARGHGYAELYGAHKHLEHNTFNFSHHINEISFGPHYPNLLNPLDKTSDSTDKNFYKFQYFLSIVPTIYTKRRVSTRSGALDPAAIPQPATLDMQPNLKKAKDGTVKHVENPNMNVDRQSIFTNQYAATTQSHEVPSHYIPGIFFKYDIEPILLIVSEQRTNLMALLVRLVNVISGVLVGGGWLFQLSEWLLDVVVKRRLNRRKSEGVLHGRMHSQEKF